MGMLDDINQMKHEEERKRQEEKREIARKNAEREALCEAVLSDIRLWVRQGASKYDPKQLELTRAEHDLVLDFVNSVPLSFWKKGYIKYMDPNGRYRLSKHGGISFLKEKNNLNSRTIRVIGSTMNGFTYSDRSKYSPVPHGDQACVTLSCGSQVYTQKRGILRTYAKSGCTSRRIPKANFKPTLLGYTDNYVIYRDGTVFLYNASNRQEKRERRLPDRSFLISWLRRYVG